MSAEIETDERVYKYPLELTDWCTVLMPEGAMPLRVATQGNCPMLWARVSDGKRVISHHFRVAGTGHRLGSNVGAYIGTFEMMEGTLVLHVFAEAAKS